MSVEPGAWLPTEKNMIFLEKLVDSRERYSIYTSNNEGGAPLATTSCALVYFQRDVHRKVIS
jgi:hypothetical protein